MPGSRVSTVDDDGCIAIGPLSVTGDGSKAMVSSGEIPLTHAQRLILLVLARNAGRVLRRTELYEEAFARPMPARSRAVDVHVSRLRRALGPVGQCILSTDRVGYRLDGERLRRLDTRSAPSETAP